MKYVHYDKKTYAIKGFYTDEIHSEIPQPSLEITDEQWLEALENGYNHVDIENKKLFYKSPYTDEELLERRKISKIEELKRSRDKAVSKIVVEVDSIKLNGDEISQERMLRAASLLTDDEKINWITYDNQTIELTRDQLLDAVRKAGIEQTEIFIYYNSLREAVLSAKTLDELREIEWQK